MADIWDQFPDAAAAPAAGADPWAAFPDAEPSVRAPGAAAHNIPIRGTAEHANVGANIAKGRTAAAGGLLELAAGGLADLPAKAMRGVAGIASGTGALLTGEDPIDAAVQTMEGLPRYIPSENAQQVAGAIGEKVAPVVAPVVRPVQEALSAAGPAVETAVPALAEAALETVPLARSIRPLAEAAATTRLGAEIGGRDLPRAAAPGTPLVPETKPAPLAAGETAINPEIANLRRAGYKGLPSEVRAGSPGAKVPGRLAERIAGEEGRTDLILENQKTSTRLAGEEFGRKGLERFDDKTFDQLKAPHFRTYEAAEKAAGRVKATPEFESAYTAALERARFKPGERPSITKVIGALRRQAATRIKSDKVETQEAGFLDREAADLLEEQFGARLAESGNPKALEAYRKARQGLAKVNDVETATRAGQIDASILLRLKRKNVPLSGRLDTIAKAAEFMPQATKHSLKTASRVPQRQPVEIPVAGHISRGIGAVGEKLASRRLRGEGVQGKFGREVPEPPVEELGTRIVQPPVQDELELLGPQILQSTPGQVGRVPPRDLGAQTSLDIPGPMILEAAPGTAPSLSKIEQFIREMEARGIRVRRK